METALPQSKLTLGKVYQDIKDPVEHEENADKILARLSSYPEWETLKERITNRILSLEHSAKVTQTNLSDIDDLSVFGFKRIATDLIIDELKGILFQVDGVAEILSKRNGRRNKK